MPVASLSHLLFSIAILIAVSIILVFGFLKGVKRVSKILAYVIPLSLLLLIYFWSQNANNFVNSFIFTEKAYKCTDLGGAVEIPLPERTVLVSKSEVCDYSYRTYSDTDISNKFFNKVLDDLKRRQSIMDYSFNKNQFIVQTKDFKISIQYTSLDHDYKMIHFKVIE